MAREETTIRDLCDQLEEDCHWQVLVEMRRFRLYGNGRGNTDADTELIPTDQHRMAREKAERILEKGRRRPGKKRGK